MKYYADGSEGVDEKGDSWMTLGAAATTDWLWADFSTKRIKAKSRNLCQGDCGGHRPDR